MTRTIIVHHHLFKNAGTSFDHALQTSLGDRFTTYERPGRIEPAEIAGFLDAHPTLAAVSSHNARLPPAVVAGATVVPVIFVRHPLDRVRSVFEFEARQRRPTPGSQMARQGDIKDYVRWRLDRAPAGDRAIVDFQVSRLEAAGDGPDELSRALDAVQRLPFVGLVEAYDDSLRRLWPLVSDIPGLRLDTVRLNATAPAEHPLPQRLRNLEDRLGRDLTERLISANQGDLVVWETVRGRYSTASTGDVAGREPAPCA